jgi:hypothetical protein
MKLTQVLIPLTLMYLLFTPGNTQSQEREVVQIAVLLDTSSSMDGLINQAKSQLWKIVNELSRAKRNGLSPKLEVAVFEYGNDSLPASENYIRMAAPLTDDLDRVSEELFKLTTNGGSEFCGTVIERASTTLNWDTDKDTLKMIFIAGNEPFTQGEVDYEKACRDAISIGIVVNTIFCGDNQKGVETKWKRGADLADGSYLSINQNDAIVHIPAPQDDELARLNNELNKTYIGYGAEGEAMKMRQEVQDRNASAMAPSVAAERAVSKASDSYSNSSWDIVDAVTEDKVEVAEMDEEALPDVMRDMNKKEREEYVEKLAKEREQIQKKISELSRDRESFIAKERKKMADTNTLDDAVIDAVHKQAKKYKFTFEN